MLLKNGMTGTDVANWQRFLISQGFDIDSDGDFGPGTEKATIAFQRANGLDADGKAGAATLAKAEMLKPVLSSSNHVSEISSLPTVSSNARDPRLAKVHPKLADRAAQMITLAAAEGYVIQVSQGLRTFEEQDALFRKRPVVTRARGGQSMHNYGLAVDFVFIVNSKVSWDEKLYKNLGRWAGRVGLEWGGNWTSFRDLPHCQLHSLPSYKVLLPIYQKGGLKEVWARF